MFLIVVIIDTDTFSQPYNYDWFFAISLICMLSFFVVVRVVSNYFKNKLK